MMKNTYLIIVGISLIFLSGCQQKRPLRVYTERAEEEQPLVSANPHAGLSMPPMMNPHAGGSMPPMMAQAAQNPQLAAMLKESMGQVNLKWETPQGWTEEAGTGMRLVTFVSQDQRITCSVTALGGKVGSLQQNVLRWLGQAGLSLSPQEITNFTAKIAKQTNPQGLSFHLVDFTGLTSDPSEKSMIAAIVDYPDGEIFVKMTGAKVDVVKNRTAFESLLQSLKIAS